MGRMSRRAEVRQRRQAEILSAAAAIFADRGYHQTRLEDVGSAVGISGPALYRYFRGKDELLAEILIDISIRLVDGARNVLDTAAKERFDAEQTLVGLLKHHVEFAVTEPDLIRVQEREIRNLAPQQREKVRSLQRTYLTMWVQSLRAVRPELSAEDARVQVQLTAGLINSSRHIVHWAGADRVRDCTVQMAIASLNVPRNP